MNNKTLNIRPIKSQDLKVVSDLLISAFEVWTEIGFNPDNLNLENVSKFLLEDGYLFFLDQEIVGTVCIRHQVPQFDNNNFTLHRAHRKDKTKIENNTITQRLINKQFTYFYSLAVSPKYGKKGYGKWILNWIKEQARNESSHGLLLETGLRTNWLQQWYIKNGFQHIGEWKNEFVFMAHFFDDYN